jgi:CRISPR-associated protein Cas5d
MPNHPPVSVRVWGDFACFTRPEMKVERVSYEVMTPSAARGVLESIFWKPEIRWQIISISVMRPIRHFSILRNEVTEKIAPRAVNAWMAAGAVQDFLADENRAQRHTLALRDVAYRIDAQPVLREHADKNIAAYRDQFRRRVTRGQCHVRPCLGCREFAADFADPDDAEKPISFTGDLGQMLFDLRYDPQAGRADPVFFEARLEAGVLHVPQELYEEVNP